MVGSKLSLAVKAGSRLKANLPKPKSLTDRAVHGATKTLYIIKSLGASIPGLLRPTVCYIYQSLSHVCGKNVFETLRGKPVLFH